MSCASVILIGIGSGGSFNYEIIPKCFNASVMAASFSSGHFCCLEFSRLRFIIVFSLNNAILLLDLSDIEVANFQPCMFQHILFNFLIGRLALRRCQIQLIQIQLHLDMLLCIKFGQ